MKTIINSLIIFFYLVRFYFFVWFTNYFEREPINKPYKKGYKLTFEDNFDSEIDWENKWNKHFSQITETPDDGIKKSLKCVKVEDGELKLYTEENKGPDKKSFPFISGYMCSKGIFDQYLGVFEADVKANEQGKLWWGCWWLYDPDLLSILKGPPEEVDISEFMSMKDIGGKTKRFTMTNHFPRRFRKTMRGRRLGGLNLSDRFYTYTLKWDKNKLVWYLNNLPVYRQVTNIPQVSMCLVLSIGGYLKHLPKPEDYPGIIAFRNVRVYQKNKNE